MYITMYTVGTWVHVKHKYITLFDSCEMESSALVSVSLASSWCKLLSSTLLASTCFPNLSIVAYTCRTQISNTMHGHAVYVYKYIHAWKVVLADQVLKTSV